MKYLKNILCSTRPSSPRPSLEILGAGVQPMRKAKVLCKSEERILRDGNFVVKVLSTAEAQIEQKYRLISEGYDFMMITERVCSVMNLKPS